MLVQIYELKDQSENNEEQRLISVFEVVAKERLEHRKNP